MGVQLGVQFALDQPDRVTALVLVPHALRALDRNRDWRSEDAIWLHEFFYALMQGYDAVAMETDVQIGATEQLFNRCQQDCTCCCQPAGTEPD